MRPAPGWGTRRYDLAGSSRQASQQPDAPTANKIIAPLAMSNGTERLTTVTYGR
jgi:hypothetical protein